MIVVALGANLPAADGAPPLLTCRRAAESLRGLPGLRLRALSRWYATAPIPASDQPDYVNGVAVLDGAAGPVALLAWLQAIEQRAGRVRGARNGPRVLDLDIVAIDAVVRTREDPLLPHPRMHERAFVLRPMAEIAPHWRHPVLGRTVVDMLDALPAQEVTVL
jgi:2-amino-4-hydroxy-6-hydroxymethyldihydropteridine diphosphokinase